MEVVREGTCRLKQTTVGSTSLHSWHNVLTRAHLKTITPRTYLAQIGGGQASYTICEYSTEEQQHRGYSM
jgi:hypothetical protein